jgi:DMSO/TMAO reductase YedYZ molybdopterin-dependent catalytic subunit
MAPIISRGFSGRRRDDARSDRVPPGQYVNMDYPVLSAGPTPHTPFDQWDFSIVGEVDEPRRWTWEEFRALPSEEVTVDIHCVTKWSKLDTSWQGVSIQTLLDRIETSAEYVVQYSDGGYTTNLPLEDLTDGKAWVAFGYDGEPLEDPTAGPDLPEPAFCLGSFATWLVTFRSSRCRGARRRPTP